MLHAAVAAGVRSRVKIVPFTNAYGASHEGEAMTAPIRLGLAGAGPRGLGLVSQAYAIGEQEFFLSPESPYGSHPYEEYDHYGTQRPEWVEDVRDLTVTVTDVFDPDREARERALERCRDHEDEPTAHDSFESFLETSESDAVIVASPNDTHLELALPLLERDLDLLCEKPVATTLAGHDELENAVEASDGQCIVGFNLRSSPLYAKLAELIHDGAIGELGMLTAHNVRLPFRRGFRYERERSGGSLLEKNCHDFDLFNWYADADPVRVAAFTGQQVLTENTDVADHGTVIVEYENGVKATLELCLYAPFSHRGHRFYEARGSDGLLRSPLESGTLELCTRDERAEITVGEHGDASGHGGADLHEMKTFLECLRGRAEPPATITDAKRAAAIALGADRASETGEVVEITSEYDLRS